MNSRSARTRRGTNPAALTELRRAVSDGSLRTTPVELAAAAHDASHYLLQPTALLVAKDAHDVASALAVARRHGLPVTFRSGGTSLSGQSVTSGLLVDTQRHFTDVEVLDAGARVRCQPGATVRTVNARLFPYGRRLGPDPASEIACTVGGVVANNSSGMTSGTEETAYRTIESAVIVLPSGTVLDTASPHAEAELRADEPELHDGLLRLRERLTNDPSLCDEVRRQFALKNTMGYGLNALVDYTDPVDILTHLVVGSEGTLGFLAQVTLRTLPRLDHAATTLLVFESLPQATDALPTLIATRARAIELLDANSLRVAQQTGGEALPALGLTVDEHTALLVEYQAATEAELDDVVHAAHDTLATVHSHTAIELTRDPRVRSEIWRIRKGLYAALAGSRPVGSTALLEDVVVPPPALTGAVRSLTELLAEHGYQDAAIFGHAKDGNLHFMISPALQDPAEVCRYEAFTEDLVDLVLGLGGSLKAEHGTGRIMAPFVRRQYGDQLHQIMVEIKALFDSAMILNPGVLISDDPSAHLKNLKVIPVLGGEMDRCVECGFCEPGCPSRNTTTTPRQRIALLREMAAADDEARKDLRRGYDYAAVDTCAADSLCALSCPVGIDTGKVMKAQRTARHGRFQAAAAVLAAKNWRAVIATLRAGLRTASLAPDSFFMNIGAALGARLGARIASLGGLPSAGRARPRPQTPSGSAAVFFPACIGSLFGAAGGTNAGLGVTEAFLQLCRRAAIPVSVPDGVDGLCCATPWTSKGYTDGAREMARRTLDALWTASQRGTLPIVCDASSCSLGLDELSGLLDDARRRQLTKLDIVDAVTFVRRSVLPRLRVTERIPSLALHPTCATTHLGIEDDLRAIASAVAEEVFTPTTWGCCGFAGDRGLAFPELTRGATERQVRELSGRDFHSYASSNRTCELGMSLASGKQYQHVLELLEIATRAQRVNGQVGVQVNGDRPVGQVPGVQVQDGGQIEEATARDR